MSARTLAVGDIHGCHVALQQLLVRLALTPEDKLIVLGDVVDRGPGSKECIELLMAASRQCELILIQGNHEQMMLDALDKTRMPTGYGGSWLHYGGAETLQSYGGDRNAVPQEHLDFVRSSRDYWEDDKNLYIHANLEPGVELSAQTDEWIRWTHLTGFEQPHPSGKRIVCGHTPQRSGLPLVFPGWACIDTLAFAGGWLTALDVVTDEIFQANQQGKVRSTWIR